MPKTSGSNPFSFAHCADLSKLPAKALEREVDLHGGFAVDKRPGKGQVYTGVPGCGLLRVSPDLGTQDLIELPTDLLKANFHSTKIGEFDGQVRLFMPSNDHALVAVLSLEGDVEFILPRPEFDEYQDAETPFKPTDTAPDGGSLLVADGYGANYISTADVKARKWKNCFGGKTTDSHVHGQFGTAHGINKTPAGNRLAIADRAHSRLEMYTLDGNYSETHAMPDGSRPCGIDYANINGRSVAVVGSLNDPQEGRPAPIYIIDAETYAVLSTIRPKEDLGVALADHIHNAVWDEHNGQTFLLVQSWNPGHYFVLAQAD